MVLYEIIPGSIEKKPGWFEVQTPDQYVEIITEPPYTQSLKYCVKMLCLY